MQQDQFDARYRIRQEDIAPAEQMRRLPVHLLGAGGIGSMAAFQAAKLGIAITVYDGDIVEPENINNQMFSVLDLGRPKVLAVRDFCALLAAAEIQVVNDYAKGGEPVAGIVIEALDSMAGRAAIWQNVILPRVPFLEAMVSMRMGAESGSMFTVRPGVARERIWYEANGLYSDDEAMPLPCTGRATSYCSSIAAALAVYQVKRLLMRQRPIYRRIDFDLDGFMFFVEQ